MKFLILFESIQKLFNHVMTGITYSYNASGNRISKCTNGDRIVTKTFEPKSFWNRYKGFCSSDPIYHTELIPMNKTHFELYFILLICVSFAGCRGESNTCNIDARWKGYWIPEHIKWKSPETSIPEIDKNTNVATFGVLYIDSSGICDLIYSTQTSLKTSDSIGIEYEPGMELWKGRYLCQEKDSSRLIVNLKPIPDENGRFYDDDKQRTDTLSLSFRGKGLKILFRNESYIKTNRYDSYSVGKMKTLRRVEY